jgi:hypothetical protein
MFLFLQAVSVHLWPSMSTSYEMVFPKTVREVHYFSSLTHQTITFFHMLHTVGSEATICFACNLIILSSTCSISEVFCVCKWSPLWTVMTAQTTESLKF